MSYVTKNLIAGETLIYETGVHWCVLFWPIVFCLALIVGGITSFVWGKFAGKIEHEARSNRNSRDEPARDHQDRNGESAITRDHVTEGGECQD
jgi:hypothetical protein